MAQLLTIDRMVWRARSLNLGSLAREPTGALVGEIGSLTIGVEEEDDSMKSKDTNTEEVVTDGVGGDRGGEEGAAALLHLKPFRWSTEMEVQRLCNKGHAAGNAIGLGDPNFEGARPEGTNRPNYSAVKVFQDIILKARTRCV